MFFLELKVRTFDKRQKTHIILIMSSPKKKKEKENKKRVLNAIRTSASRMPIPALHHWANKTPAY